MNICTDAADNIGIFYAKILIPERRFFMKIRNIAAALAAVLCIGLAGCSDNTGDEVTTSAENTTTSATTTEATGEAEATSAAEDDTPAEDEEAANPLQHIADAALAVGEWPALWEEKDAQILEDFFLLDASNANYRNMIVLKCPTFMKGEIDRDKDT